MITISVRMDWICNSIDAYCQLMKNSIIQLTSLVNGHSFVRFTELSDIYVYYYLLSTNYIGE